MYIANTTITNTSTGISITTRQCLPCAISSCVSCPTGASLCIACTGGWYLYGNTCVQQCPNSTYVSGVSCSNCSTGCFRCANTL
jgi:proprotein convertase subtilisin/kexin type 5